MPADRIETEDGKKIAHYELRDFLSPGGKYPYDLLSQEMEEMRNGGYVVYVWSVPGFMMASGHPDREGIVQDRPWHSNRLYHRTAADCLSIRDGVSYEELFPDV